MADAAADQPHDVDVLVTFEHRKADSLAKLFESVSASDPQAIRFEGIDTATPVLWIKDRRLVGRHVDAVGTNLLFRVGTEADKKELKYETKTTRRMVFRDATATAPKGKGKR
eukprot:m.213017 g.213017  ORF g.213017 m.213017 type:complete len:112 (+) comp15513_c0_seq4:265-600(+)